MQYRDKGIIVKTQKLNEADRILRILTEEHGLVSAIAKGARKSNSSLAAKTQTLNECDFLLAKGKNLDIVSEVSIVQKFSDNNQDLLAMYLAFFAAELCEKIAQDEQSLEDFFYLLEIFLEHLKQISQQSEVSEELQENQKLLLSVEFLWCIICELGYKPELNYCSLANIRRKPNQIPQYFDLSNGSICSGKGYELYREGYHTNEHVIPISKFTFKLLDSLDRSALSNLGAEVYIEEVHNSDASTQKKESYSYRKILIEEFLINYLQVSLSEGSSLYEFSIEAQNSELKSTLKLLYKHIEFQTHSECRSWSALADILD
ncbi:MAG: DNA repair protein RecO [Candidatus Caenarcaniphilales bacterium]|nr:DNA repair protein RecO [Candidatus Caenarcaniphilales bacterium]